MSKYVEARKMNKDTDNFVATPEKKYYPGIDLFKFLCAILVIMIHANPFGEDTFPGMILRQVICPIAVPFFFAASGFFLSFSSDPQKHIAKIIKSYLTWSAVYFPFVIVKWILGGSEGLSENLLNYIRSFIFEGSYQTIWFLNALWFASSICVFLLKFFKARTVFRVSIPWYVFSCLLSSWHGLLLKLPFGIVISNLYYSFFETTKNGLLFGFTYVALGAWIAETEKLKNCSDTFKQKNICVTLIPCLFLIVVEYVARLNYSAEAKGCDVVFSLVPITAVLLKVFLRMKLKPRRLWQSLRTYSTLFFLTQRIPLTLFTWIDYVVAAYLGFKIFTDVPIVYFCSICASTFLISFIITKLSKRFRFLTYIY